MADKKHVAPIPASQETRRVTRFYIDALEKRIQIGVVVEESGGFETYEFDNSSPDHVWQAILAAHPELRQLRRIGLEILHEQGLVNADEWVDE